MTQQSLLFDQPPPHCQPQQAAAQPAPIARTSDPETSQLSAGETSPKLGSLHAAFLAALRDLGFPSTASEVAAAAHKRDPGSNTESYRKRARECERLGYISEYGKRPCRITGKMATTYKIAGA